MHSFSLLVELKQALPETTWPWILTALQEDRLVWESLQGELGKRALHQFANRPEHFSPASLALLALGNLMSIDGLRMAPYQPIEPGLRQRAAQFTKAYEEGKQPVSHPLSLGQAGLLAIHLYERRRAVDSWDVLSGELGTYPPAVFSCLIGMIPDPENLVTTLVHTGFSESLFVLIRLAVHAVLSNPVPPEKLNETLRSMLNSLPNGEKISFLRFLSARRPRLAAEIAADLSAGQPLHETGRITYTQMPFQELELSILTAEVHRIAGHPPREAATLAESIQLSGKIQAELSAQLAEAATNNLDLETAISAWESAVRLNPAEPDYRARLSLSLMRADRLEDAQACLNAIPEGTRTPSFFFAQARLAVRLGDLAKARQAIQEVVNLSDNEPDKVRTLCFRDEDTFTADTGLFVESARLCLDLGLPEEASRAILSALRVQPGNSDWLALLAQSFHSAGKLFDAVQAAHLASGLAPERLDFRRRLAEYLEASGDWKSALSERKVLLQRLEAAGETAYGPADLRELANCALHAGVADQAIQACQKALQLDPDDSLTYALLGESFAALDDFQQAFEHLSQSTHLDPQQAAPWLATARTYQKAGQPQKALETLQKATRAAPELPEVHLALGEAYLEQGAPTQARIALRRAGDLASSISGHSHPAITRITFRLGQSLHQLGHLEEAHEVLHQAHAWTPNNAEIAYAYGQILLALNKQLQAIVPLEKVLQSNPIHPDPYLDYARCILFLAGQDQTDLAKESQSAEPISASGALPALRRVLEIAPHHSEGKALIAEALAASGDSLAAMEAYRQALDTELTRDASWLTRLSLGLGQVALKIGQVEKAIAALQEANQSDPQNPDILRCLAEAYDAAGLTENAYQAARAALQLAPNQIDVLTWFADQALELSRRPGSAVLQAKSEAVNALSHAAQLAPHRTDLLIRIGQNQIQVGDLQGARGTFNKLVSISDENPDSEIDISDLKLASQYLLQLGDASGAVACLERALQSRRRRSDWKDTGTTANLPTLLDLLTDLAAAQHHQGSSQAALETLEQAILIAPNQARLYLDKADLHLEMGLPDFVNAIDASFATEQAAQIDDAQVSGLDHVHAALDCLDTALQLCPDEPDLHQRAALIQRTIGNIPKALDHAVSAINSTSSQTTDTSAEKDFSPQSTLTARILAADLARALLDDRRARSYLDDLWEIPGSIDPIDQLEYYCLRAELALEAGESGITAEDLSTLLDFASDHPWVLGIQARLIAHRSDLEVAYQILRDAVEILQPAAENTPEQSAAALPESHLPAHGTGLLRKRIQTFNSYLSVAQAAIEMNEWELALQLLERALATAPNEMLAHLRLARSLVLRAEYQRLCQNLDVVQHAPGESAINPEIWLTIQETLQKAEQLVTRWQDDHREFPEIHKSLNRWCVRGQAIFQPGPACTTGFAELNRDPSDVAAQVAYLGQIGDIAGAGLAARAFPQHPRVLVQLSLALEKEKPRQALAAVHAAVEALLRSQPVARGDGFTPIEIQTKLTPYQREDAPLVHGLLARLVHQNGNRASDDATAIQAIQTALSFWPDEPRWHALAAEIYQNRGATGERPASTLAIDHLEQAIKLEPRFASHHIKLGKLYFQEGATQKAIQSLEQATRLAPDQIESWLTLALAYRAVGDLERAASQAEHAVSLAPEDIRPLLLRGEIALETNNPRGAQSRAQAAMRLNAEDPAALLLLARSLSALDKPGEALSVLDKAIPLAQDPLPFQLERARLLLRSKGQDAALQALQELSERYPDEPAVLTLLAESLAEAGQREAAIQMAQRALRAEHHTGDSFSTLEHANVHFLLGRMLRRAGQLDQAIHHLTEAIQHAPNQVEPFLELGHTHQERRQFSQAISAYTQVTRITPNDARGYYYAGLAFKENKDYVSAETMLRKAAQLAPNDLSVHRLLAAVVAINLVQNRREAARETHAS